MPRGPSTELRSARDDDAKNTVIPSEVKESRSRTEKLTMSQQNYFVYIVTNHDRHTVLYIGVTNDLERRANEHSLGHGGSFSREYNAHKVIYFETFPDPDSAIAREKQLKNWTRAKKESLISKQNPAWRDLVRAMHAAKPAGGGSR